MALGLFGSALLTAVLATSSQSGSMNTAKSDGLEASSPGFVSAMVRSAFRQVRLAETPASASMSRIERLSSASIRKSISLQPAESNGPAAVAKNRRPTFEFGIGSADEPLVFEIRIRW